MSKNNCFVVDAWAWIEYFDGSNTGEHIRSYLEDERNTISTSAVTLAEVVSKFLRTHMDSHQAVAGIAALSVILPVDAETASFAGELHAEIKAHMRDFGLADAFVLAAARQQKARILTGDPHFMGFKEAILFSRKG